MPISNQAPEVLCRSGLSDHHNASLPLRVRRLGPQRRKFGTIIKLAPDVAALVPTAEAVNRALRALAKAQQ